MHTFLYVEGVGGGISKGRGNILLEPDLVCNYALIKRDVFVHSTDFLSVIVPHSAAPSRISLSEGWAWMESARVCRVAPDFISVAASWMRSAAQNTQ